MKIKSKNDIICIPEGFIYTSGHLFRKGTATYELYSSCKTCGLPFLGNSRKGKGYFCDKSCASTGENNSGFGRPMSSDLKEKLRVANKNKVITEETRIKLSLSRSGPKNHNWKGGLKNQPYCDAWNDKSYKEDIRKRDNYRCQNVFCTKISTTLNIHHINYVKKDCHPENLITLCVSCNFRANYNRDWHQDWYSVQNKIRGN